MTHSYTPENTAPAKRWEALVKELSKSGFQFTVVAPQPVQGKGSWSKERGFHGETILRIPGVQSGRSRITRLTNNVVSSLSSIPRAKSVKDADVVIATVPALTTSLAGLLVSKALKLPLVLEMRDAWPDLAEDAGLPRSVARTLMESVLRKAQRSADAVITVTEGFAEQLRTRGVENTICIPNGLTEELPAISPHPGRIRSSKLQVLYAGNHGESQGLSTVIRAAAMAREFADVTFIGSGTQKSDLQGLAQSIGAPVRFLDPSHGSDLQLLYEQADTCVVSLRPDWRSFQWTIPSKTYEVLSLGRKLTAIVQGEAQELVERFQPNSIVGPTPEAISVYWHQLVQNPECLVIENIHLAQKTLRLSEHTDLLAATVRKVVSFKNESSKRL